MNSSIWTYFLSLGVGLLVGVGYGLVGIRSPAPPVVALVGLLGMLLGEQLVARLRPAVPVATATSANDGQADGG